MLCTEIVFDIQNNFCTQQFSPCSSKRRASDKDLPVKEMVDTLSENGIEESQPPITEIVNFIKKVSPRCSDYLLKCLWHSKVVNCSDVSFNFIIHN